MTTSRGPSVVAHSSVHSSSSRHHQHDHEHRAVPIRLTRDRHAEVTIPVPLALPAIPVPAPAPAPVPAVQPPPHPPASAVAIPTISGAPPPSASSLPAFPRIPEARFQIEEISETGVSNTSTIPPLPLTQAHPEAHPHPHPQPHRVTVTVEDIPETDACASETLPYAGVVYDLAATGVPTHVPDARMIIDEHESYGPVHANTNNFSHIPQAEPSLHPHRAASVISLAPSVVSTHRTQTNAENVLELPTVSGNTLPNPMKLDNDPFASIPRLTPAFPKMTTTNDGQKARHRRSLRATVNVPVFPPNHPPPTPAPAPAPAPVVVPSVTATLPLLPAVAATTGTNVGPTMITSQAPSVISCRKAEPSSVHIPHHTHAFPHDPEPTSETAVLTLVNSRRNISSHNLPGSVGPHVAVVAPVSNSRHSSTHEHVIPHHQGQAVETIVLPDETTVTRLVPKSETREMEAAIDRVMNGHKKSTSETRSRKSGVENRFSSIRLVPIVDYEALSKRSKASGRSHVPQMIHVREISIEQPSHEHPHRYQRSRSGETQHSIQTLQTVQTHHTPEPHHTVAQLISGGDRHIKDASERYRDSSELSYEPTVPSSYDHPANTAVNRARRGNRYVDVHHHLDHDSVHERGSVVEGRGSPHSKYGKMTEHKKAKHIGREAAFPPDPDSLIKRQEDEEKADREKMIKRLGEPLMGSGGYLAMGPAMYNAPRPPYPSPALAGNGVIPPLGISPIAQIPLMGLHPPIIPPVVPPMGMMGMRGPMIPPMGPMGMLGGPMRMMGGPMGMGIGMGLGPMGMHPGMGMLPPIVMGPEGPMNINRLPGRFGRDLLGREFSGPGGVGQSSPYRPPDPSVLPPMPGGLPIVARPAREGFDAFGRAIPPPPPEGFDGWGRQIPQLGFRPPIMTPHGPVPPPLQMPGAALEPAGPSVPRPDPQLRRRPPPSHARAVQAGPSDTSYVARKPLDDRYEPSFGPSDDDEEKEVVENHKRRHSHSAQKRHEKHLSRGLEVKKIMI